MHIQLVCFPDVLLYQRQQYGVEEDLGGLRLRGNEDSGRSKGSIGCPIVRTCDGDEGFPGGNRGQDLEGLGQLAALVAAQDQANL